MGPRIRSLHFLLKSQEGKGGHVLCTIDKKERQRKDKQEKWKPTSLFLCFTDETGKIFTGEGRRARHIPPGEFLSFCLYNFFFGELFSLAYLSFF